VTARQKRGGAPAWMVTFGDLMALLTTFFILLLSFSQIDAQQYKNIAGSMERAFGVQWIKKLAESRSQGEIDRREQDKSLIEPLDKPAPPPDPLTELQQRAQERLQPQLDDGLLELRRREGELIISFRHEAAFESGSETLVPRFRPIIDRIAGLLAQTAGQIVVAGHTDDVPISTPRFRSNWDLSTARSVSVVHQLLEKGRLPADRLVAQGHGASRPLVPNEGAASRAKNRRVEIRIKDEPTAPTGAAKDGA